MIETPKEMAERLVRERRSPDRMPRSWYAVEVEIEVAIRARDEQICTVLLEQATAADEREAAGVIGMVCASRALRAVADCLNGDPESARRAFRGAAAAWFKRRAGDEEGAG